MHDWALGYHSKISNCDSWNSCEGEINQRPRNFYEHTYVKGKSGVTTVKRESVHTYMVKWDRHDPDEVGYNDL